MRRFLGLFTGFANTFLKRIVSFFAEKRMAYHWFFRPKKPLLRQTEFRNANFLVLANEDVGWSLLRLKKYEPNELKLLEQVIRKNDVCIDVGANIGIYSVFMAKKAYNGEVVAFEPVPFNRNILAINMGLNGITNVQIHGCVLSDTVGAVRFSVSEDTAYSSLQPTNVKQETSSLDIQADTLDNLFAKERQKVDVMKIDVEGAELLVLKGGEQLLSAAELRPRALLVELGAQHQSTYGYQPEDVVAYMGTLGYAVYSVTARGAEKGWPMKGAANVLFIHNDDRMPLEVSMSREADPPAPATTPRSSLSFTPLAGTWGLEC